MSIFLKLVSRALNTRHYGIVLFRLLYLEKILIMLRHNSGFSNVNQTKNNFSHNTIYLMCGALSLLIGLFFSYSCKGTTYTSNTDTSLVLDQKRDTLPLYPFRYDLSNPDAPIKLPLTLNEISGIVLSEDEESFLAIQDEDGIVYKINKEGKIIKKIPFWKKGDYEDLILVKDTVYVVKSTGTIYEIINLGSPKQYVEKHNTSLGKENDVEGITYDPMSHHLLLACKGEAYFEEDKKDEKVRNIYEFSLATHKLISTPKISLTLDTVRSFLAHHQQLKDIDKLEQYFAADEDKLKIHPSALAYHPITKDLYILSSNKRLLLVIDKENNILHIERLNKSTHPQPEGLTFSKNGDLYISDEGDERKATIHRYKYKER